MFPACIPIGAYKLLKEKKNTSECFAVRTTDEVIHCFDVKDANKSSNELVASEEIVRIVLQNVKMIELIQDSSLKKKKKKNTTEMQIKQMKMTDECE